MMVAEQPAMAVVMPAVMARVVMAVMGIASMGITRMGIIRMGVSVMFRIHGGGAAVMRMVVRDRMGMAVMAMIMLAFAHGAVSIRMQVRVTRPS